jgi:hypothetical protein
LGEVAVFAVTIEVTHPMPDVADGLNPNAPPVILQPGEQYYPGACVVTAR